MPVLPKPIRYPYHFMQNSSRLRMRPPAPPLCSVEVRASDHSFGKRVAPLQGSRQGRQQIERALGKSGGSPPWKQAEAGEQASKGREASKQRQGSR
jgi:hypothetical protein